MSALSTLFADREVKLSIRYHPDPIFSRFSVDLVFDGRWSGAGGEGDTLEEALAAALERIAEAEAA